MTLVQGLRIAWHALSLYYGTVIPTGEEARLFFTSFGQQWCRRVKAAAAACANISSAHSVIRPNEARLASR